MGYISNIRIKLEKEVYKDLVNKYEEERLKDPTKMSDLFEKAEDKGLGFMLPVKEKKMPVWERDEKTNEWVEKELDGVYFGWNGLKWYDGYKDVDFIMDYIRKCENYAFARLGEESDDIEQESNGFDDIYVYTAFEDDEE